MLKELRTDDLGPRARDISPVNVDRRDLRKALPLQGLEIDYLRGGGRSGECDGPCLFFFDRGFLFLEI